jgi:hypothetical protein
MEILLKSEILRNFVPFPGSKSENHLLGPKVVITGKHDSICASRILPKNEFIYGGADLLKA